MKILQALSLTVLSVVLLSCREHYVEGRGGNSTDSRAISKPFNTIEIDAPVDASITVQPGGGNTIALSGYGNVLKYITTEVRDSTLFIKVRVDIDLGLRHNLSAVMTTGALAGVAISGGAKAQLQSDVTTHRFAVDISGGGIINLQSLTADKLKVDVSGAGVFSVAGGKVAEARYDVSGAAKVKTYGLECARINFDLSGAGAAEVFATGQLNADISGAAQMRYKGDPKVTADVSGAATITRQNGAPANYISVDNSGADNEDSTDDNW